MQPTYSDIEPLNEMSANLPEENAQTEYDVFYNELNTYIGLMG